MPKSVSRLRHSDDPAPANRPILDGTTSPHYPGPSHVIPCDITVGSRLLLTRASLSLDCSLIVAAVTEDRRPRHGAPDYRADMRQIPGQRHPDQPAYDPDGADHGPGYGSGDLVDPALLPADAETTRFEAPRPSFDPSWPPRRDTSWAAPAERAAFWPEEPAAPAASSTDPAAGQAEESWFGDGRSQRLAEEDVSSGQGGRGADRRPYAAAREDTYLHGQDGYAAGRDGYGLESVAGHAYSTGADGYAGSDAFPAGPDSYAGGDASSAGHGGYAGSDAYPGGPDIYAGREAYPGGPDSYAGSDAYPAGHDSYAGGNAYPAGHDSYAGDDASPAGHDSYAGDDASSAGHDGYTEDDGSAADVGRYAGGDAHLIGNNGYAGNDASLAGGDGFGADAGPSDNAGVFERDWASDGAGTYEQDPAGAGGAYKRDSAGHGAGAYERDWAGRGAGAFERDSAGDGAGGFERDSAGDGADAYRHEGLDLEPETGAYRRDGAGIGDGDPWVGRADAAGTGRLSDAETALFAGPWSDPSATETNMIDLSAPRAEPRSHRDGRRRRAGIVALAAAGAFLAGAAGYIALRPDSSSSQPTAGGVVTSAPAATTDPALDAPAAEPTTTAPSASASPVSSSPSPTTAAPTTTAPTTEAAAAPTLKAPTVPATTRPSTTAPTTAAPTRTTAPAATTPAAAPLTAVYGFDTSGDSGYVGTVTVNNPGSTAVTGWQVRLSVPSDAEITVLSGGVTASTSGSRVTFGGAAIAARDSVTFTFSMRSDGDDLPSGCTINGNPCS
ncbi:cellulose binding domain-containing protein [Paractinoplanes deccanensis]|nr:cellulose binding domain-containing protein [Actinoplanes deccanensis]